MKSGFTLIDWAAWAPGLATQEAWRAWLRAPVPLPHEGRPELSEMAAMQRRRIDRLGRMALQVAYWCQGEAPPCPMIFASRHGDVARSEALLRELAAGEPLSPTSFGMSVHNAIGALYSIARGDMGNYQAICAGAETVEAAFVEATSLLAAEAQEVMVIVYDQPLPEAYRQFADEIEYPYAWACRLGPGSMTLSWGEASAQLLVERHDATVPHALQVLDFLIGTEAQWSPRIHSRQWCWSRNG